MLPALGGCWRSSSFSSIGRRPFRAGGGLEQRAIDAEVLAAEQLVGIGLIADRYEEGFAILPVSRRARFLANGLR